MWIDLNNKMHLYLLTRGIFQQTKIWEMFLQSQFFPWKRKNLKTKKDETTFVQGSLRPLQLWEYVIPEESMDEVFTCMGVRPENLNGESWKHNILFKALRKLFKAAPVPKDWKPLKTLTRVMRVDGVGVNVVGIKKDKRLAWEEQGYEQEML